MKLVVYMPAHNEEATIGLVIDKITNVFNSEYVKKNFTETAIAVLNDNSTDRTKLIAQEKGAYVFDIRGESRGVGRSEGHDVDREISARRREATIERWRLRRILGPLEAAGAERSLKERVVGAVFKHAVASKDHDAAGQG